MSPWTDFWKMFGKKKKKKEEYPGSWGQGERNRTKGDPDDPFEKPRGSGAKPPPDELGSARPRIKVAMIETDQDDESSGTLTEQDAGVRLKKKKKSNPIRYHRTA